MGYLLFVHSAGHTVTTGVVPTPRPSLKLINVSLNTGRLSDRSTAALYSCYIPLPSCDVTLSFPTYTEARWVA